MSRIGRLLYVLALFQLLGGPMMLCGVVFVLREAKQSRATAVAGTGHAAAAPEHGIDIENGPKEIGVIETCPDPPRRDIPLPSPNSGRESGKWLTTMAKPVTWRLPHLSETIFEPPVDWRQVMIHAPPEAPPPPPPRSV
jgi:hypothetical protein